MQKKLARHGFMARMTQNGLKKLEKTGASLIIIILYKIIFLLAVFPGTMQQLFVNG